MRSVWPLVCGGFWVVWYCNTLQYFDNWENRSFSNSLSLSWKPILVDHTSLSHCVAVMLQFLEKYLLLDILRPTSRIGSLALTNTGSHPCMCQEGESLNQLTLMVPLKKKWLHRSNRSYVWCFLLTQLATLVTNCLTCSIFQTVSYYRINCRVQSLLKWPMFTCNSVKTNSINFLGRADRFLAVVILHIFTNKQLR